MNTVRVATAGAAPVGMIGPNTVLQLTPLLERRLGRPERVRLMMLAGIHDLPSDQGLMDERPAARLHEQLRRAHPAMAPGLLRAAGQATADYIIKHRIPAPVVWLLQRLPAALSAPLLVRAIEQHAWTFAGSGRFRVLSRGPIVFELADNPLVCGERSEAPLCVWHTAVFERLWRRLVSPKAECAETACIATGDSVCRYQVSIPR